MKRALVLSGGGSRGAYEIGAWQALTELSAALRLSGLCETCSSRNICHPCAAIAMAEAGTTEGVPRYKCRITQAISEIAKKTLDETT